MNDIKESFVDLMEDDQWMGSSTKQRAIKKLNTMKRNVDYQDWIMNDTELDSIYDLVKRNFKLFSN